jgi:regulatory protein
VRITKIESQKNRPARKNIYADGAFVAGVSAETLLKLALRTGDELSPAQLDVLQKTEALAGARSTALRFLGSRPRSTREMRNKLREKEFTGEEIDRTIADLTASGLLNDTEFARMFIRNAMALRPLGPAALKRKLLLLGVEKGIVEEAIAETLGAEGAEDAAAEVARKFLRKARMARKDESSEKLRQRLSAFLARRGFGWETIRSAVASTLGKDE